MLILNFQDNEFQDNECPICLEQILDYSIYTNCGHTFHIDCLEKCNQPFNYLICPLCRQPIQNLNVFSLYVLPGQILRPKTKPLCEFYCFYIYIFIHLL